MTQPLKPLHVATIRGQQLRFFRTPNNDGRPDMPWHCCDDLYRCMGLPRDLRRHFQRSMSNGRFRRDFKSVATVDGVLTIAPHYTAQGLIGAAEELRHDNQDHAIGCANIKDEYAFEGAAALQKLAAGLHGEQLLDFLGAAFRRHDGEVAS
jgi:hypothetical protein